MPHLTPPTASVRDSYLRGEREMCAEEGTCAAWVDEAERDFAAFVERRGAARELWGVPVTELWWVDGPEYVGTVVVRHRLTPALVARGGHVGYHVVPACRGRGHATRMLAEALAFCAGLGLARVLVTCAEGNVASRRVIEANGGVPARTLDGEARYWLATGNGEGAPAAASGTMAG